MAKTRTRLIAVVKRYVEELERLGVPVERVILYGSHPRGGAHPDSDVDLAVFSEAFGPPDYREFSGVLSEAAWATEPMIEAMGFHPSCLEHISPTSFLHEIVSTGQVVHHGGVPVHR
jgi:predicted nucleotidyltransferase